MGQADDTIDETMVAATAPAPTALVANHLPRGTNVDRYTILGFVGGGAMGVVYAAHDPELDRKVALKLIRFVSESAEASAQVRMQREAQAMARLSHPNVVTVHDVGRYENQMFLAMEFVAGTTLREWLMQPRPWREVLDVFLPAGRGLAAAHAAGLIHRDFKPENVLIGQDGRVRVSDFGVARGLGADIEEVAPSDTAPHRDSSKLDFSVTHTGHLLGTPLYMAPEQVRAEKIDARADQFSFCVSLYEGLYGERPFMGETLVELTSAATQGQIRRATRGREVPMWVREVVVRGLSADPAKRHASMDELIAALSRDPSARRRKWMLGGAAIAVLVAAVVVTHLGSRSAAAEPCQGLRDRLTGVWDGATEQAVRAAFDSTKRPFAATTFARIERQLDAVAGDWTATATDSCAATRVRGEQSDELLSLRQACLDERLEELRALTALLAHADGELVDNADKLAARLEPVASCSNVAALLAPGTQPPTEPKAMVDELHTKLAEAKVLLVAGRFAQVLPEADRVAALADEVHYPRWKAEALDVRGAALFEMGRNDDAGQSCKDAGTIAMSARLDGPLITAALCSAMAAVNDNKVGEAKLWLWLAKTTHARPSMQQYADDELQLLQVEAIVAAKGGDGSAALAARQKVHDAAIKLYGADNPTLWQEEAEIAEGYAETGAYDKARPYFERAIAHHELGLGDSGATFALMLSNLGACYSHTGDPVKARTVYERALALQERDDTNTISLAFTLNNMADGLVKAGEPGGAILYSERARDLLDKALGRRNALYHAFATTHAEALTALGRLDEARAELDEVIALETTTRSQYLGATLSSRAELELAARHWKDAVVFENRAVAVVEAASGKDAPELWRSLAGLGRATLELGQRADGRALLERAIALGEKADASAADLEPARTSLKALTP